MNREFFDGEEELLRKMVDTMFELPSGTVITTLGLMNKTFGEGNWKLEKMQFLHLTIDLMPFARKAGIRFGDPFHGEAPELGMPWVFPMIIRHGKREKNGTS